MVGTFCSSSYMYLGWVLKNLCSSGTLACKSLNLHIIPFILFASLVGCSSSDSGSNLLPFNSFTPSLPPEFAIEIEGINPEEGIYYSKNSSPDFKFSNVRDGASVSLHEMEECAGELVSSDSTPVDGQVSVGLKNPITDDGEHTYYAKHANGAEVFDCLEIKYHLDTLAPAEPAIAFAEGTTSPSSDNTNPRFLISSIEIGAIVSLHTDSACSAEAVALGTATGDSITLTLQTALSIDETYTYFAKQVDRAGNISDCSSAGVDYELDSTAPNAPTIGLAQGTSSSSINTTPSFVVSGVEDGALVSLHTDDQCAEANIESGTATGDSITLTLQTALSADGTYTYFAKQVDRAGNISDCSSAGVDYELDTKASKPTVLLAEGATSPSNDPAPSFVVSGVESGATISLHTDSECLEANKVASSTVDDDGDSIELTTQTALNIDGAYNYYAKQVNQLGNSSCSDGLSYELDTQISKPTIMLPEGTTSPSKNNWPIFVISGVEGGAKVSLHTDSECLEANKLASNTASSGSIELQSTYIGSAVYTFYAKQVDKAGNSSCSDGLSHEIDTIARPPVVVVVQRIGNPSNNPEPIFAISTESGSLVSLYSDRNNYKCLEVDKVASGTADDDGFIELKTDTPLSVDGTYTYYAKQVDKSGNISRCVAAISYTFILDTSITSNLSLKTSNPSGDSTPVFLLKGLELGSTVNLYSDDNCGNLVQGPIEVIRGTMNIELSTALGSDGTYSYSEKQTDSFGNILECSTNTVSYELDSAIFQSVWRVGNGDLTVTLPLRENDGNGNNFVYDFDVYWGDGSKETVTAYSNNVTHTYANARDYTIKITGILPVWYFNNEGDRNKIIKVENLGIMGWKNLKSAFDGCTQLTEFTAGITDTSQVTDMSNMFNNTISLASLDVSHFNTAKVTNMRDMFRSSGLTSLDLRTWNVGSVTNKMNTFYGTKNNLVIKCSATPILSKDCTVSQ